jgi:hypothetical protein
MLFQFYFLTICFRLILSNLSLLDNSISSRSFYLGAYLVQTSVSLTWISLSFFFDSKCHSLHFRLTDKKNILVNQREPQKSKVLCCRLRNLRDLFSYKCIHDVTIFCCCLCICIVSLEKN